MNLKVFMAVRFHYCGDSSFFFLMMDLQTYILLRNMDILDLHSANGSIICNSHDAFLHLHMSH